MALGTVASPAKIDQPEHRRPLLLRGGVIAAATLVLVIIVCVVALYVGGVWAFQQSRVIEFLHEATDSQVTVAGFHRMYFPQPGCVLEKVVLVHSTTSAPLATIERLTIRSTYLSILRRRITRIDASGVHASIPTFSELQAFQPKRPVAVDELIANDATVELATDFSEAPLQLQIREATLRDIAPGAPLKYRVKAHSLNPPAELSADGIFGAWNDKDSGQASLSGEYKVERADLGYYGGIAGTLSTSAKFDGQIGHINVSGTADVPDLEVNSNGHHLPVTTQFNATVDGTDGDAVLNRADVRFRKTEVIATGTVAKSADGKGKTAVLQVTSKDGRIEDILALSVNGGSPPMSGKINLRGSLEVPVGQVSLGKVKLQSTFGIAGGEFSRTSTQEQLNKLSAGALGEKDAADTETALTDLAGEMRLDHGVAHFSNLSFRVPGATARFRGTFNILNNMIDLHGQMQVETKVSNTTSGVRALLLKVMDPFFKKRKTGELVPVKITGNYKHPTFGLDPMDKKAQVTPPKSPQVEPPKSPQTLRH